MQTYFGFRCPNCESTVDIGAGSPPDCPNCGAKMVPNQGAQVTAKAHCKKCDANFGIINSDKCPFCGTPFD